jgi:hypothetical protein
LLVFRQLRKCDHAEKPLEQKGTVNHFTLDLDSPVSVPGQAQSEGKAAGCRLKLFSTFPCHSLPLRMLCNAGAGIPLLF